jgi:hypothetical protein
LAEVGRVVHGIDVKELRSGVMFVRVFLHREDKEVLFNTDNIWKMEVSYSEDDPKQPGRNFAVSLGRGLLNDNRNVRS